ncbi:uncharacterized protein [Phyllobates terribilis]|uniref:uncharacterized protein n=1 Tax=Phyllobates terribilis TaxID=111132 RepID=UPI003CCB2ADA
MKSSRTPPAAHSTSAPIPGARKAKTPLKSPCTSAPAATGRTPAGGASALNPKRGASSVSVRIPRERHSVPAIQKPPLKLLDPEKVRSLTSASRLHVSGGTKQNPILHQTTINKQPPRSCKQSTLPRSSVKLTTSSRKRTGIDSRREIINPSGGVKIRQANDIDTRSCQLWHQMNHLLLDDKGCEESRKCDKGQLENVQPGEGKTSGQTVPDHAGSLEESNIHDQEKSSHMTDLQAKSWQIDKAEERTLVSDPQTGNVQEQGDYKEPQPSCHQEENHATKESHNEGPPTHLSCPDNVVDGLLKPSPEAEPTTGASSKKNDQSSCNQLTDTGTSDHKSQPVPPEGEKDSVPESNSASSNRCKTILGPNLPQDEQSASEMGNQEPLWSRTYDIIRQSQGVLVLTRSTDDNAVFIPKLKFDFTPDNSVDWTRPGAPPPLGTKKGGAPIKNHLGVLNTCTPRGPTFSKSMLKKSSMLYGQDIVPGVSSESALADISMIGACPLDRIVDLSISFQGKYEEQEIPADIPKILLTEEDYDED